MRTAEGENIGNLDHGPKVNTLKHMEFLEITKRPTTQEEEQEYEPAALAGVAPCSEHWPAHPSVSGSIPRQRHVPGLQI